MDEHLRDQLNSYLQSGEDPTFVFLDVYDALVEAEDAGDFAAEDLDAVQTLLSDLSDDARALEHHLPAQAVERDPLAARFVRCLDAQMEDLEDSFAEKLAESENLCRLTWIILSSNSLTADGASRIGQSEHFRGVHSLCLDYNPLGDEGVAALLEGPAFERLRVLGLSGVGMTNQGLMSVLESPCIEGILQLDLGENEITDVGAAAVANCPALGQLTSLGVWSNNFGPEGKKALAASSHLPDHIKRPFR